ncbi:MAG TPA: 23S rRNA (adenine(2030)-N(6))-methyltransferase RlmJ [Caulobacteraceae bacterium]|nr:23S rRNA (adenine(2030)-N(6))-methyltransferase RlmJ [Caulobacteraceae bacterium]
MNYRHAFHAGNFADLVKHAAVLALVRRLTGDPSPLLVIDTHAGAGLYDLEDAEQARSKEAEAGVKRLMGGQTPPPFAALREAVERRNPDGGVRWYPGSPSLIVEALRPGDRYVGCELREDEHGRLAALLARTGKTAEARRGDGYEAARELSRGPGRRLLLIDPPFERADDYLRTAETLGAVLKADPRAAALVWLPLKDLETLDGFARRLEALRLPRALVAEARLRPLHDPMKMNGCALVAVNPPDGFEAELEAICAFVVEALGAPGGRAKLWRL